MENENLNVAEETQEVATPDMTAEENDTESLELTDGAEESTEQSQSGADNTAGKSKEKDVETQKAFSARLADKTAEAEARIRAEYEARYGPISNKLKEYKLGDTPEEQYINMVAADEKVSKEEAKKMIDEKRQKEQEAIDNNPTLIAKVKAAEEAERKLTEARMQLMFEHDLKAIKEAFPDCKAKDVKELGETYFTLVMNGRDPVEAYAAQVAVDSYGKKEKPASMGGIKGSGQVEKDYYTSEEVDALPESAYNDPKIKAKIRSSMLQWGKKKNS